MSHVFNLRHQWTPAQLGTLFWFDAADSATITASAGAVSQWDDKSGNGYDVIQDVAADQPTTGSRTIGGLNVIDFSGVEALRRTTDGPYARNVGSLLVITLMQDDSLSSSDAQLEIKTAGGATRVKHQTEGTRFSGAGRRLDSDSYQELDSTIIPDTNPHIHATIFDYSNAEMNWSIDGTLDTAQTYQTSGNTSDTDSTAFFIGAIDSTGTEGMNGAIGEMIVVEDDITTATLQKLEGYIAWRWGRVSTLPSNHPYKNHPPYL